MKKNLKNKITTPACMVWVFISCLSLNFFILQGSTHGLTRSENVQVTIPSTTVRLQGRASPAGLVTISKNGVSVASTTADSTSNFSVDFIDTHGLQTYELFYIDVNGRQSARTTRTVSLQPQQINAFSFFLSPTAGLGSTSSIVIGDAIIVQGSTVPNAIVTVQASGNRTFQTLSQPDGNYTVSFSSNELGVGTFQLVVSSRVGSQTSGSADVLQQTVEQRVVLQTPDITVRPDILPPPTVILPVNNAQITGDSIFIRGEAIPRSQIVVYENGLPIGSTIVALDGSWFFTFRATSDSTELTFQACIGARCSAFSAPLELTFTAPLVPCSEDLFLQSYRFWNIPIDENIRLDFLASLDDNGQVLGDWGDGRVEVLPSGGRDSISTAYKEAGLYSGRIRYVTADCESDYYFSVQVVDKKRRDWYPYFLAVTIVLGLTYVAVTHTQKIRKSTVQKTKNKL